MRTLRRWFSAAPLPKGALVLRLLLLTLSFVIAYQAQHLLQDEKELEQGAIMFLVAAIPLWAAWFLASRNRGDVDHELPDSAVQTPEASSSSAEVSARLSKAVPPWALGVRRWIASHWLELVLVGAVMSLAGALRFYKLGSLPFGVFFDEVQNATVAQRILDDPLGYHPVFVAERSQVAALSFYIYAGAMGVLGQTVLVMRSTSAIAGLLAVPALYLLGRELYGHRVALIAAILLAVMRWHLNFSRIAFNQIFNLPIMLLALYFLVRGFKGHGRWNFAVAGVLVGLGLQLYYAFVFVPVIIVIFGLHYLLTKGRKKLAPVVVGTALLALVAAAIIAPLANYAYTNPDNFFKRADTTSITRSDRNDTTEEVIEAFARNTKKHALMFNVQGDFNGRHNLPPHPMLDRLTGMFFVLGIAMAVARPLDSRYFLLVIWLVILTMPGIWTNEGEAPQAYRTLSVTPAVALLAALPLGLVADLALKAKAKSFVSAGRDLLSRVGGLLRDNLVPMVAAAGLLFVLARIAFLNYDVFFNQQLESGYVWRHFEPLETIVARELAPLGTDVTAFASPNYPGRPAINFQAPNAHLLEPIVLPRDVPFQSEEDVLVFIDGQRDSEAASWIRSLYPDAEFKTYHPPGEPQPILLYQFFIPLEQINASYGVEASYRSEGGGAPVAQRESGLAADWRRETPLPLPFTAEWTTTLKVPEEANQGLRVEAPGKIRLSLNGQLVAEGEGRAELREELPFGLYDLTVEVQAREPGQVRMLWRTVEGGWTVVPETALFRLPVGARGLVATYYTQADQDSAFTFSGPPLQRRIDPYIAYRYHVNPIPSTGPFAVKWEGTLTVPEPGGYILAADSRTEVMLMVDGEPYLSGEGLVIGAEPLFAGGHAIELRYASSTGGPYVFLYWQPPPPAGADEAEAMRTAPVVIPFSHLSPDKYFSSR